MRGYSASNDTLSSDDACRRLQRLHNYGPRADRCEAGQKNFGWMTSPSRPGSVEMVWAHVELDAPRQEARRKPRREGKNSIWIRKLVVIQLEPPSYRSRCACHDSREFVQVDGLVGRQAGRLEGRKACMHMLGRRYATRA